MKLIEFSNLQTRGLELERQSFNVYLSTEIWDSDLTLNVNNKQFRVLAEGLHSSRFNQQIDVGRPAADAQSRLPQRPFCLLDNVNF